MNTKNNAPLNALRHHVSGAIERGEKVAIAGIPAIEHNHAQDILLHQDCPRCRLNAAAPELLEALQGLLIAAQRMPQPVTHDGLELAEKLAQARIAIRKATTKPAL